VRAAMSHYVHVSWGWYNDQMTIGKPEFTVRLQQSRVDAVHSNKQKRKGSAIDSEAKSRPETYACKSLNADMNQQGQGDSWLSA
jgi:hypothetical protein